MCTPSPRWIPAQRCLCCVRFQCGRECSSSVREPYCRTQTHRKRADDAAASKRAGTSAVRFARNSPHLADEHSRVDAGPRRHGQAAVRAQPARIRGYGHTTDNSSAQQRHNDHKFWPPLGHRNNSTPRSEAHLFPSALHSCSSRLRLCSTWARETPLVSPASPETCGETHKIIRGDEGRASEGWVVAWWGGSGRASRRRKKMFFAALKSNHDSAGFAPARGTQTAPARRDTDGRIRGDSGAFLRARLHGLLCPRLRHENLVPLQRACGGATCAHPEEKPMIVCVVYTSWEGRKQ